jgi:rSAM/selenodomain-associated transferase 1
VKVVVVMTRAPLAPHGDTLPAVPPVIAGPKTRLASVLPNPAERERLQRGMLADVLAAARGVPHAIVRLSVTPGGRADAFADLGVPAGHVSLQRGETLGDRERAVFLDLFRRGAKRVLLIGSDLPLLTTAILSDAFGALDEQPARVVLGPASDGGYYLLGLAAPTVPDLFTGVRWSTKYTLMDTLRRCEFEERRVAFLPLLDDMDTPEDLAGLRATLAATPGLAPNTAAALNGL